MEIAENTAVSRNTGVGEKTGNLIFSDIPSGHTYILRETKAPEGYAAAPDHAVVVRKGIAYVFDKGNVPSDFTTVGDTDKTHTIIDHYEAKAVVRGEKILAGAAGRIQIPLHLFWLKKTGRTSIRKIRISIRRQYKRRNHSLILQN